MQLQSKNIKSDSGEPMFEIQKVTKPLANARQQRQSGDDDDEEHSANQPAAEGGRSSPPSPSLNRNAIRAPRANGGNDPARRAIRGSLGRGCEFADGY